MITAERVSALTDKVVALNHLSDDQSDKAKFDRIWRVINANCGTDVRQRMFKEIQSEMTRRSAEKSKANAAARKHAAQRVA